MGENDFKIMEGNIFNIMERNIFMMILGASYDLNHPVLFYASL